MFIKGLFLIHRFIIINKTFFFFFIIFRSPTLCTNWAGNTCGLVDDSERSSAATQAGAVHPTRGKRRLNFYRHVSHEWNLTDLALDVRSSRAWSSLNVKYRLMLRCGDGGMRWARCSSVAPCEWEWQRWCDVMATIFNSPTIVPSCDTCKARINLPGLELTSTVSIAHGHTKINKNLTHSLKNL